MNLLAKLLKGISNTSNSSNSQKPTPETNISCEPHKQSTSSSKAKKHKVAGVAHYKENILSFAQSNAQYSLSKKEMIANDFGTVYEYSFRTGKTELIPEPTNQYDSNAIKVMIDGKHVGYIKKGSCKHIINLLNQNQIERIESKISGGKFKCLEFDGEGNIKLSHGTNEYCVTIIITER